MNTYVNSSCPTSVNIILCLHYEKCLLEASSGEIRHFCSLCPFVVVPFGNLIFENGYNSISKENIRWLAASFSIHFQIEVSRLPAIRSSPSIYRVSNLSLCSHHPPRDWNNKTEIRQAELCTYVLYITEKLVDFFHSYVRIIIFNNTFHNISCIYVRFIIAQMCSVIFYRSYFGFFGSKRAELERGGGGTLKNNLKDKVKQSFCENLINSYHLCCISPIQTRTSTVDTFW